MSVSDGSLMFHSKSLSKALLLSVALLAGNHAEQGRR